MRLYVVMHLGKSIGCLILATLFRLHHTTRPTKTTSSIHTTMLRSYSNKLKTLS